MKDLAKKEAAHAIKVDAVEQESKRNAAYLNQCMEAVQQQDFGYEGQEDQKADDARVPSHRARGRHYRSPRGARHASPQSSLPHNVNDWMQMLMDAGSSSSRGDARAASPSPIVTGIR